MPEKGLDATGAGGAVVRLGISGFGRLAQNYYVPALARIAGAQVVAVADPAGPCRAAAAKLLPLAATYPSQQEMLDAEQLDGLLVASPPSAHLPAWLDAASRPRLAVFMEKPFVLDGQLHAASIAPTVLPRLMVNFNRRFWPRYQQIGRLLQSGALGPLQSAELELSVDVSRWLSVTQHRVQPGEGGALYDLGSQMLDLASVIVGQTPSTVHAVAESRRWPADHLNVTLQFASAPGAMVRCILAYDTKTRERIHVRGKTAEARIDNPNTAVHVIAVGAMPAMKKLAGRTRDFITLARHAALRHTSMSRKTIELALSTFVTGIRSGRPFAPGYDDAATNASLLEAAVRSIATGRAEAVAPSTLEIPV